MRDAPAFPQIPRPYGPTSAASRAAALEAGLDVRVWGARGSLPFAGPDTLRYGGDTCGVEIRLPDRAVYFDAGSAAPKSGKAALSDGIREIDLFLSHVHYDHIMGMPFFPPVFLLRRAPARLVRRRGDGRGGQGGGRELFPLALLPRAALLRARRHLLPRLPTGRRRSTSATSASPPRL